MLVLIQQHIIIKASSEWRISVGNSPLKQT